MKRYRFLMLMRLTLVVAALPVEILPAYGGPGGGTYFANSPAGDVTGTALRKFVDKLPGLGAANANNLGQYIPIAVPDTTTYPGSDYYKIGIVEFSKKMHSDLPKATKLRGYKDLMGGGQPAHYLGPLIVAKRDRTVRVLFENQLPTGAAGDLFIPVDTTIMGAGMNPDGVPYAQNRTCLHLHGGATPWISDGTPHQWFTPTGTTVNVDRGWSFRNVPDMPDPGAGKQTIYYTNQQSSRLMFYHDHAYGITRLNVYAGMAAGYLLTDSAEDDLIARGIIPNQGGGVYKYGIPLIIQDKTFVPNNVATQDALWDQNKYGGYGDLWFPHVYEPNQDPNSADGMNPFGRWDYGSYFWPIFPAITPLSQPSIVPEAFMDTMLVNGTAYPYLEVELKAYRFRILNACNDRYLNLQLYYADPDKPTEIRMVPAIPNPNYPDTWPTDGRAGGVPNPADSGQSWIQIGSEGGFLPQAVVIDNQPVNYDYDRRSVTFGNVKEKALFLGPAERATSSSTSLRFRPVPPSFSTTMRPRPCRRLTRAMTTTRATRIIPPTAARLPP